MTKVRRARLELFIISLLTLFLELACIRWFPSHVLFLTFFTNTVLLACILGISVGCLAANSQRNFLPYTPMMLIVGLGSAHLVERPARVRSSQRRPQLPQVDDPAVRPDRLRAGRLAGPAQQLQQHSPRELPVYQAGDGRRAAAAGAAWRVRHVQLLPPRVDCLAPAELGAGRIRRRGAGLEPPQPERLGPYYAGLLVSLFVSALVPMEYFLGMERTAQIAGSSLLAFVPILFAGVIFAVSFSRVAEPNKAFGANIAGAMFSGLAEYSSMLLGFQYLLFVAVALYLVSMAGWRLAGKVRPAV